MGIRWKEFLHTKIINGEIGKMMKRKKRWAQAKKQYFFMIDLLSQPKWKKPLNMHHLFLSQLH